jgi:glycosyltransferase involved in cell wall biosynthesis
MDYSIIVPVYNSENSLEELFERLEKVLNQITSKYEIIFVDDHSRDQSWEKLTELKEKSKHVTIIRLSKNFGQHNATVCGIYEAKGNIIITIDDDLEHPPENIPQLIDVFKTNNYSLLYGITQIQHKSQFRRYASQLAKYVARTFAKSFGEGSAFRVIKKELADKLKNHNESYIFIDEVLYWYTNNFGVLNIEFDKRKYGDSNYSTRSLFQLQMNNVINYSTIPLKLMLYVGLFMTAASFLLGILSIGTTQSYSLLVVVILFSTGILLISLGFLGEYVAKMFTLMNKKPQFNIIEKIDGN